jgi:hypothetical protein
VQAKDTPDAIILAAMVKVAQEHGPAFTWDIENALPTAPYKVVRAKLKSMKKRNIIDGCACGCRGDWVKV